MPFKWTLMVFLAGDNNLSEECIFAINEMKKIGSTDEVAVIVELDTPVHENTRLMISQGADPAGVVRELNESRITQLRATRKIAAQLAQANGKRATASVKKKRREW